MKPEPPESPPAPSGVDWASRWTTLRSRWSSRLVGLIALAIVFRFGCYGIMQLLGLWNELRPAPSLPDLIIDRVPYIRSVAGWNYVLWLASYTPVSFALLAIAPRAYLRYSITAGLVSLARGLTIVLTGLGPVDGNDLNPDRLGEPGMFWKAYVSLVDPIGVFKDDTLSVWMTKDLFFSGHTATTFLLLLYVWRYPALRWVMLIGHVLVVASVFFAHLHYSIDVVGAYAITLSIFALREGRLRETVDRAGAP